MVSDEGNHLAEDVFIELIVADGLVGGFHLPVHPAFVVDAIDRKYFHSPAIDQGPQCFDQLKTFVFQVVGRCGRDHQQGKSVMSVGCNGHVLLERRTEPTVDFALHVFSSDHKSTFCS